MKKKFDLSIILFAYNEDGNLSILLKKIFDTFNDHSQIQKVFISICIQGSKSSLDEVKNFNKNNDLLINKFKIIYSYHTQPIGIKEAFKDSFLNLPKNLNTFLTMDCDLNHNPIDSKPFFEKINDGIDVIVGSRYCRGGKIIGMPIWKRTLSISFNKIISIILRFNIIDKTSGYRLIRHDNLLDIINKTNSHGFPFYSEFLFYLKKDNKKLLELPITFNKRTIGVSKMRIFRTVLDYLYLFYLIFFKIKK